MGARETGEKAEYTQVTMGEAHSILRMLYADDAGIVC